MIEVILNSVVSLQLYGGTYMKTVPDKKNRGLKEGLFKWEYYCLQIKQESTNMA